MRCESDQRINVEVTCPRGIAGIVNGVYDLATEGDQLNELLEVKMVNCSEITGKPCESDCPFAQIYNEVK